MGEQIEEQMNEADMNNSEATFDNFTILKEFSNIANLVKNEDFLETVPKAKLRRVKWVPMFNCLKQGILDEMVQEISSMWEFENMPEKLEILEKQKEKFSEINTENNVWRPQHNDVKSQLRASDVANLRKQKTLLETLAKEYETRAARLKKSVTAKRGYLKALQMDIQKYQKKNEDIVANIHNKISHHGKLAEIMLPNMIRVDEINWSEKVSELN
ncbi:hypothetical protein KGM_206630 [Danaus plexippus plexippus]|uniref:Uncharacterized protein n=1 Tax=Danaus plexippus plexippus TaxID=278856 RepID=A0A212EZF2_DANPL|nr:uncharacterized protein LOC116770552 [Danaus plexippus plexippus]OWR46862.1 hypothetical protein KGM_206630 [Danaus plexippus plexippus]